MHRGIKEKEGIERSCSGGRESKVFIIYNLC